MVGKLIWDDVVVFVVMNWSRFLFFLLACLNVWEFLLQRSSEQTAVFGGMSFILVVNGTFYGDPEFCNVL